MNDYTHIVLFMIILISLINIFIPSILENEKKEIIKNKCGYIFNPATSISNYTSYKHCLEYPESYGVDK